MGLWVMVVVVSVVNGAAGVFCWVGAGVSAAAPHCPHLTGMQVGHRADV